MHHHPRQLERARQLASAKFEALELLRLARPD